MGPYELFWKVWSGSGPVLPSRSGHHAALPTWRCLVHPKPGLRALCVPVGKRAYGQAIRLPTVHSPESPRAWTRGFQKKHGRELTLELAREMVEKTMPSVIADMKPEMRPAVWGSPLPVCGTWNHLWVCGSGEEAEDLKLPKKKKAKHRKQEVKDEDVKEEMNWDCGSDEEAEDLKLPKKKKAKHVKQEVKEEDVKEEMNIKMEA
ncbi:uncharacterized protein EV422DRAFT_408489 [Fimicolochytrium jonesii]|uniref:uncharacterized protein n=1 Tax=Fimicolochytrium jonesii TaxID=1396493 RepID=UPI0022FED237|nr:uncharacterized protein EV422DRAFT_408489 [Fimicolochytrium jonesii]KAI8822646.1 hypothetical protein EV422DRAFT_408489 [Fimicolochytrium jonesii]